MPIEIARQNLATAAVESPVGVEVMDVVKGQYRGQTVQVTTDASKLMEAAEEIGMAVAGRGTARGRDIRAGAGRGSSADGLSRSKGKSEDLPDMPGEAQTASLVDQVTAFQDMFSSDSDGGGGGEPSLGDVLSALNAYDPDVTHQFAALQILRDHAEKTGADPRLHALLDAAQATFETADMMRDVRAGQAAAAEASRAAATLEIDPGVFRDTYRGLLRETRHSGQLFDALRGYDLLKSFDQILDSLTVAAGRDLASTGPSTDPAFLSALLTELGKLKRLRTAVEGVGQGVMVAERTMPRSRRGVIDVLDQASRALHFFSASVAGPSDAKRALGGFAATPLGTQIAYGNALRGLHSALPDEVVPSPQARIQQGAAIIGMLDGLVAAEDGEADTGARR